MYVHVAAVDRAGNVGAIKTLQIPIPVATPSQPPTPTASQSPIAMMPIETQSHSTALIVSNSYGASMTQSLTLIYSLYITETKSIINSFLSKSFSISISKSTYIYTQTDFIFYEYTVIVYSSYFSFYSDFFVFYQQSEIPDKDKTNIYIIIGVVVAAIVVILLLSIFLIRVQKNKKMSEKIKSESSNQSKTIDGVLSSFSIPSIEEDPFEKDFKEDFLANTI